MKTKAAVCGGSERSWQVEELDLDDPKPGEAMVRLTASGLCHSDEHLVTGDIPMHFPVVGGHEGAGVIPKIGSGSAISEPACHYPPTREIRRSSPAGPRAPAAQSRSGLSPFPDGPAHRFFMDGFYAAYRAEFGRPPSDVIARTTPFPHTAREAP
ncbi:hypothetical protein W59_15456 [Rhodococcus opacus RKJ300 = JCM 13270]|uniref:alcohol dehydrogenase n=2 Tax=Rhodococcus opacus TaxID=37919 RepID=C1BC78_RHOOB|nr:hypothetical protein W59_15456 [Rhodococcus opacus RKJ300 = JCM 13270]QQZ19383.1 alcohol dehydrogenase catalytic domain-containing protein [Rhodococcus sp. 21391]BAH55933.1 hypothetical protein ROP_pROB01-04340 [Rhodococcus opacus B4]